MRFLYFVAHSLLCISLAVADKWTDNSYVYDDYRYATLDGDNPRSSKSIGCQGSSTYLAIPSGWELVPYSSVIVSNVVNGNGGSYAWGTQILVFSNGAAYWTSTGGHYANGQLRQSGNTYAPGNCSLRILIRLAVAVDCVVSDWSEYGDCDQDCGGGNQIRTREIEVEATTDGEQCPEEAELTESQACNEDACPTPAPTPAPVATHCQVGEYGDWSACAGDCGSDDGSQSRTREITVNPTSDGDDCPELEETQACTTEACPTPTPTPAPIATHCEVGEYGEWSACAGDCGSDDGTQARTREITVNPTSDGDECPELEETRDCTTDACLPPTEQPTVAPTRAPTRAPTYNHCELLAGDIEQCSQTMGCEADYTETPAFCRAIEDNHCVEIRDIEDCVNEGGCEMDFSTGYCTYVAVDTPGPTTRQNNYCSALSHALDLCFVTNGCIPNFNDRVCEIGEDNECAEMDVHECHEAEDCWFDWTEGYEYCKPTEEIDWDHFNDGCSISDNKKECKNRGFVCKWDKEDRQCVEAMEEGDHECGHHTKLVVAKRERTKVKLVGIKSPCQCQDLCNQNLNQHWRYHLKKRKCECIPGRVEDRQIVASNNYLSSGEI